MTPENRRTARDLVAIDEPQGTDHTADRSLVGRLVAGSALMLFLNSR